MPHPTIDRRYATRELRALDQDGALLIEGYAAIFNAPAEIIPGAWGWWEEILPGAFANCLAQDVRALFNHNANLVLGRTTAGTLALWEDATGLGFRATLPETQAARDLHASISRGDISGCSFSFLPLETRWIERKDEPDLRQVVTIETLFDVGPVTYPAYNDTSVSARSREDYEARERAARAAGGAAGHAARLRYLSTYDKGD